MIIAVSNLTKEYKVPKKTNQKGIRAFLQRESIIKTAVDHISFSIEEGELVGFIGPNGAGKTTTLKMLSGLLYPTSGTVKVLGFTPFERKSAYLCQIALVMGQKNQLWWDLPAVETFRLQKEIYKIPDNEYKKTLGDLIDLLDVSKVLSTPVRNLSLGERMKMEIITALLYSPRILFLDEPTIGLDVVMQKKIRDFIGEYNKQKKATILLTSHYMEDVKQLASRVIIIHHGSLLFDGKFQDLIKTYSTDKLLTIELEEKIPAGNFKKFGTIISETFPMISLKVPSSHIKKVAAAILDQYPVVDVTIEDPDIEDIVRDVFTKKS